MTLYTYLSHYRSLSEPEKEIDEPRNIVESGKTTLEAALAHRHHSDSCQQERTKFEDGPEGKGSLDQPGDGDQGVAMLLMMRRNKGKSDVHLPAPLSKASIKTQVKDHSSSSRGLPSSHPYYRSARVLASPKPGMGGSKYKDQLGNKGVSDVKYEQQRARATNIVYRYPVRPFMQHKSASCIETEHSPTSPRVYIPPPIFSPRRLPSNDSIHSRSSLSVNYNRDDLVRPHSAAVPSEPLARRNPIDGSISRRLPYPTANALRQQRRDLPDYPDYSSIGNGPFPSPIRESFIRSNSGGRIVPPFRELERRLVYQGSDAVNFRRATVSPPDLVAYDRGPNGLKRGAPEDFTSYRKQDRDFQQTLPRLRLPDDYSENEMRAAVEAKRARTDSADSSTSGSGNSPPNRMRYIAPSRSSVGSHLIPHSSVDQAQQRRQNAYRSPSPSASRQKARNGDSARNSGSFDFKDAEPMISQALAKSGKSESAIDTARALADVAATLARVAESLKDSIR